MRVPSLLLIVLAAVSAAAVWLWQPWEPTRKSIFGLVSVVEAAPPMDVALVSRGDAELALDAVAKGFELPWDLAFLSKTELLVTEKAGALWRLDLPSGERRRVTGLPEVRVQGQGGLHAVIPHPRFAENGWIYLSYAAPDDRGANTHFLRARLVGDALTEPKRLLAARAPAGRGQHFGGAMAFDREGYLYLSVGDRGERDDAQSLSTHNGKILRLHDDGRVPVDNPYGNMPGALPEIWSYGHRNPQGLALDAATGRLWEAEHGPQGGDEINLIQRGRNYGWPVITYGREYGTGFKIGEGTAREDVAAPVHYYAPSIATAGMAFYDGAMFPEWKNSVFVAALRGHLNRVQLDDQGRFVKEERLLGDLNLRMRGVRMSPNGELWVITDNGVILRITRKKT